MGYNTCYSLRVKHIASKEEWDRLIGEMNERDLLGYAFAPSSSFMASVKDTMISGISIIRVTMLRNVALKLCFHLPGPYRGEGKESAK